MTTIVDSVANVMPWAGSGVPAVMTYQNVQKLGFEPWQAAIIGLVVEGIGFVSITTTLDIYEINGQDGEKQPRPRPLFDGSFWTAAGGTAVYLVAVLMVNAILDGGDGWQKLTLALLSLFGVVGGVMVALRNQLNKRRASNTLTTVEQKQAAEREREAAERREREEREHRWKMDEERLRLEHEEKVRKMEEETRRKLEKFKADGLRQASESTRTMSAGQPDGSASDRKDTGGQPEGRRRWSDIPASEYGWIAEAPASEIVKKYGLTGKDPERLARTWKKYAREKMPRGMEEVADE